VNQFIWPARPLKQTADGLSEAEMNKIRDNRWTPPEDDLFRRMAEANTRPELIAAKLNRSVHAIKARAYAIGLPLKWFKLKAKGNRPT
jgi:hypothetical protein